MVEITLDKAKRIVHLREALNVHRNTLKTLENANSVRIVVTCIRDVGHNIRRDDVELRGSLDSQRRRSAVAIVRQAYETMAADCERQLRQLGAEVPNG